MHVYSGFQGYPISNLGYNYVTVYVASVALFLTFLQISVPTGFGRMINTVAGCTGGGIFNSRTPCFARSAIHATSKV